MAETEAFATLTLLESRLHHLEFLLSGSVDSDGIPKVTVKPARSDENSCVQVESIGGRSNQVNIQQQTRERHAPPSSPVSGSFWSVR